MISQRFYYRCMTDLLNDQIIIHVHCIFLSSYYYNTDLFLYLYNYTMYVLFFKNYSYVLRIIIVADC